MASGPTASGLRLHQKGVGVPGDRGSFGPIRIPRRIAAVLRLLAHYGGAVLGLSAVVLLWAGIFQFLAADKEHAEQSAVQSTTNLARSFEEHIVRSIEAIDQTLLYVRDSYIRDPQRFDLSLWLPSSKIVPGFRFQLGIIDKDGYLIATTAGPVTEPIDLSDREHFRAQADSDRDELFISKPVYLRANNVWSIQLSRRIEAPDGTFRGAVVMSLDPQYLARFYESVDLGVKGSTVLVGLDGIVRARAALGDTSIGQSLLGSKLFAFYAARTVGSFTDSSAIDGVERIYSYRAVKGYPLIVGVGLARDEVLAGYEARRASYMKEGGALSVLLVAISGLIAWHQRRLQKSRQRLRASEERYRSLMRTATDGIHIVDAGGNLVDASPSFYEMLGYPVGTKLKVSDWDAQFSSPEIQRELTQLLETPKSFDTRHRRKDGSIIDVEISAHKFVLQGQTLLYNSAHDITQRKTYEAKLLESEQQYRNAAFEAARANSTKSEFLAHMSHELRTPLNAIIGFSEIVAGELFGPIETRRYVEYAGDIHSSGVHLLSIINDILDLAKIEAGRRELSEGVIDLQETAAAALRLVRGRAENGNIRLVNDISRGNVPLLQADERAVKQMLLNLLSNAVKFTPKGGLVVVSAELRANRSLAVTVSDTGIGIAPENIPRALAPFGQVDNTVSRSTEGTGLGLPLVNALMDLHGGRFELESDVGNGTRATLVFPADRVRGEASSRNAAANQESIGAAADCSAAH